MSVHYRRVLLSVFACLLVSRVALAQFDSATVLGTIVDASGAAVPGAAVTLKNNETGITATTVTDGQGAFQFLNVRVGTYGVRAELQGFSTAVADNIAVTVNARQRVDLTMKVGSLGETVEVTFKVPAEAGSYPFLCTFPGHFVVGMKGNLVVK